MAIETATITLPACWASALINGDESSFILDDDEGAAEIAAIDAALAPLTAKGWCVIGVVCDDETGDPMEPWFTWSYAVHGGTAKGGNVIDYVIVRDLP